MAKNIYTTLSNWTSRRKNFFILRPKPNILVLASYFLFLLASLQLSAQPFVHPGGLHTQTDLDRMKAKVAAGESPWIEGWNGLIADGKSSATYGISGGVLANANQRQNMNRDAQAAYLNALRWYISGDVAHAEKAISIYNAYARTVNQIPSGGNTDILGLGGIGFTAMAVGAEIMRLYEGWAPQDFEKFKFMMKEYFYPVTHDFLTNHRGACPTYYWANWDLNNISAQIAIGILVDDRDIYNEGVEYFKNGIGNGSISNAVPFVQGNFGQWQESGRDQSHGFLGIGLMANICQLAWNQGDDLYGYDDNRFLKGAEYVARTGALSLKAPFFEEYNSCNNRRHRWVAINALGRYFDQPVWEIVYNHYVVKQGLHAPHVKAMAKIMRLSRSTNDQLGHGTLTHTLDSDQSPLTFAAPPGRLDGLVANAGIGRVQLRWNALESMDAKGYTIKRSTTPGGPYVEISRGSGSTFPGYTDSNVENGTTYYYVVSANNPAGDGPDSEEIAATPKEEGEELPAGWARADIGNLSIEGKAGYALVNTGHTFITSGAGIVGGTSDAIGFTYGVASGDVTLTARIVEFGGLQKTGIMIRESLDPNAKTVLMKIGDAGWRIAEMGARTGTGANMEWIGGNRYTWAPEIWFRISRSGNTFTVYESNNKDVWFEVGSRTIEMGTDVYVGLFNSSGNTTSLNTTRYDHVSITGLNGNAPEAPANLTASTGNTLITLNWDEVVSASSYTLKRSTTSGGPYQVVATNLSSTQYTDKGLENGTNYFYVVTAANLTGEGQNSNEVSIAPVLTLPPVPGGVVAASVSGDRIDLSWEASLSATAYNVKRATVSGGPYTLVDSTVTTSFSDSTLADTLTYYYVISAVNAIGESNNSAEQSATPGKVSYWKFDETSGTMAADSWGNRNGTLTSGASWATGIQNNGIRLNGSSGYVTLPAALMSSVNDFTIATWAKVDVRATWARIFDFGSGTTNYMFLAPASNTGMVRYAITTGSGEQAINSSSALSAGAWNHIAVTLSGKLGILYINGVEAGRNTNMTLTPASLGNNTTQNWIGRSQWSGDPLLTGSVDDFRIYSKALSASEISALVYQSAPPPSPANVSLTDGYNQVSLTWSAPTSATSYNIKRAETAAGPFTTIANVTSTGYIDSTAEDCATYFYVVSAINNIGEGANSSVVSLSFDKKLTGTLMGTNGSWGNNPATTKAAAVDGNLATFFDGPTGISWVGYDLGAQSISAITRVRYAPRTNYASRMMGGVFQGSNVADFSTATNLFTISVQPPVGVYTEQAISNTTPFRYVRYISLAGGSGNVAEVEFYGLLAQAPQIVSKAGTKNIWYDSSFSYSIQASNIPNNYSAAGLPDGLTLNACTGIISGAATEPGTFSVILSAANDWGTVNDTMTLTVYRFPTVKTKNIEVAAGADGKVSITPQQVDDGSVSYSGTLTLSLDRTDFACADIGSSISVTLTATDADGHSSSGTAQVTVVDNQQPAVTAPADQFYCYSAAGSYTVSALDASDNCGIASVSYSVSGATARSGNGPDASGSFNAGESAIAWTVTDIHGNISTANTVVTVNAPLAVAIPDVYALSAGVDANTIYTGYGASSLTITATPAGGGSPYTYSWSTSPVKTTQAITVTAAGTYTATATDAKGCQATASITIKVVDVRCGNKNKNRIVCHSGNPLCVPYDDVQDHLNHGDYLGTCNATASRSVSTNTAVASVEPINEGTIVYPNPVANRLTIKVDRLQEGALVKVYNVNGAVVASARLTNATQSLPVQTLAAGIYYVQVINGGVITAKKIVKQ